VIRIERSGEVKPGVYEYAIPSLGERPFVSALLVPAAKFNGLWRPCHRQPATGHLPSRPVSSGRGHKHGPRFRKFEPFDSSAFKAKEAVMP
jgi:hypothetical protein